MTASVYGRLHMAQEDPKTARNAKARTYTGQRMIAVMPEPEVADMVYTKMLKS